MTQQLHWFPFTTRIEFKVLFLILKSQRSSAPTCTYLCAHIRLPISVRRFPLSALLNASIFSFLVLGQLWPTPCPLLLLVRHSGIASLLLFARPFSLLFIPRISIALRLTFFLVHKCTDSASLWLTPEKQRYIKPRYNTIYNIFEF